MYVNAVCLLCRLIKRQDQSPQAAVCWIELSVRTLSSRQVTGSSEVSYEDPSVDRSHHLGVRGRHRLGHYEQGLQE